MSNLIYINGKFLPRDEARVSVLDHGFLYGSGVFETMRAYNGKVFMGDKHIERLFRSAEAVYLNIPMDKNEVNKAVEDTVKVNNFKDAYIRITVSRGEGEPGLDLDLCQTPTVVIYAKEFKPYPVEWHREGIKIAITSIKKSAPDYIKIPLKACNYYLPNFFAKKEAKERGAVEGIMLTEACPEQGRRNGYIAEGTVSNIFIVSNGILITPPAGADVLDGVTREIVIKLAKDANITFKELEFSRDELISADECFLTNTTFEILPVKLVLSDVEGEADAFKTCPEQCRRIGEKAPGRITALLMENFRKLTNKL
ncbi:MAG: aminotransferase class IV [Nitrospinae bacterium]|nr:aminotransferase class IV [Nitrospinota bacterium]